MASRFLLLPVTALLTACATTGATFRSGVGDSYPERPPHYAGAPAAMVARDSAGAARQLGHLPVAFQRGASQPAIFDPRDGSGSPAARLADARISIRWASACAWWAHDVFPR